MQSPIITGICSYGMSGKLFHAPFIESHPGYNLHAIVERHHSESRARYPNAKLCRSVEELVADPGIQLVVVNTPAQLHFHHVMMALQAGKHVIVEKPFTVTAEEAVQLENFADKEKLFLSVYHNRRYDGDYLAIKKVLNDNLLGDLKEVEMRFDRYRPLFSGKVHKEGSEKGAGALHDIGSHLADQAIQLFGWPDAVFADLMCLRDEKGSNDYFELILYYPSMRVRLKGSVFVKETYWAYILHGQNGSFLQQRSDLQEQELLKEVIPTIEPWCSDTTIADGILHTDSRIETFSKAGNYMHYYNDVHNALLNNAPNPVPASDGVLNMKLIDAAFESYKLKRIIDLQHV